MPSKRPAKKPDLPDRLPPLGKRTPEEDADNRDVFAKAKRVEGLEHLGRAIVDARGVLSGSPANYEHLRGRPDPATLGPDPEEANAKAKAALLAELGDREA